MTRASGGPSPKTVCVAACHNKQPRQRAAAERAALSEFSSGTNSTADRFCARIPAPPIEAMTIVFHNLCQWSSFLTRRWHIACNAETMQRALPSSI
jgi:hypothetical protein